MPDDGKRTRVRFDAWCLATTEDDRFQPVWIVPTSDISLVMSGSDGASHPKFLSWIGDVDAAVALQCLEAGADRPWRPTECGSNSPLYWHSSYGKIAAIHRDRRGELAPHVVELQFSSRPDRSDSRYAFSARFLAMTAPGVEVAATMICRFIEGGIAALPVA